jgi:hypothetical protein
MLKRASMMVVLRVVMMLVHVISIRSSLALLARMRLLRRVVDIVIWSHTVVARQRASNTWVPPERAALAGRRTLNRKNLMGLGPAGLLWRVGCRVSLGSG